MLQPLRLPLLPLAARQQRPALQAQRPSREGLVLDPLPLLPVVASRFPWQGWQLDSSQDPHALIPAVPGWCN